MSKQAGKVYLVGAGLGDVAYLTVRGQQLLKQAEVLIYDALVDTHLLQQVSPSCEKLDVGKRGGQPGKSQAEIDRLLVHYCQQGKQVVRLKSGDPFVFGRCTSEMQALIEANCAFEVVPGISSALAAPLLAGIPLTDPVMSRCFAVLSAHEPLELNWSALSQLETLVILMGGKHLSAVVHQLIKHGRSALTPIAVIRWAGRPEQQIWTGILANIVEYTAGQSLSPCILVIGEVVRLRDYLQSGLWTVDNRLVQSSVPLVFDSAFPLQAKTILVTRSLHQSNQFTQQLEAKGAQVIEMPALEIRPPSSWRELDEALVHLAEFDWLILTSSNGVEYFFERLMDLGQDARSLAGLKIAVVGEKTAQSLKQRGLQPDFVPPNFVADSLVTHFPAIDRLPECQILFPRVESGGRELLVAEFRARGASVVEVAAYQSGCPATIAPAALQALQNRQVNIVTFASSKTVKHFCYLLQQALGADWAQYLEGVAIASIGPQTSKTCQELLGRVDIEAQEYTLDGLVEVICAAQQPTD